MKMKESDHNTISLSGSRFSSCSFFFVKSDLEGRF